MFFFYLSPISWNILLFLDESEFGRKCNADIFSNNFFQGTSSKPGTPTLPAGVQTQFRGAHCVPVVAGAKAADPTPKPKMTPGNVNQLKSRWEVRIFCSYSEISSL